MILGKSPVPVHLSPTYQASDSSSLTVPPIVHRNPSPFRLLNDMERTTIMTAAKKWKIPADDIRVSSVDQLYVSYERMQGGFTVCICILSVFKDIPCGQETTIWRGASRRSYKDARNPVRGEMLAFSRAILYSRPTSL